MVIGTIVSLSIVPQAYAVSNAAGNSFAVINNTNDNLGFSQPSCSSGDGCIALSSDGAANNIDHGLFVRSGPTNVDGCLAVDGATFVKLSGPMTTTTLISTLSFITNDLSSYCTTANTWHIFKSSNGTIWTVKLDGSANIPALVLGTNIKECQSTWNFNTIVGCFPPSPPPPSPPSPPSTPVSAPVVSLDNQPTVFSQEVDAK